MCTIVIRRSAIATQRGLTNTTFALPGAAMSA
jgi:hypothetical protein